MRRARLLIATSTMPYADVVDWSPRYPSVGRVSSLSRNAVPILLSTKICSGGSVLSKSRLPVSAFCVVMGMKWKRRDRKSRLRSA